MNKKINELKQFEDLFSVSNFLDNARWSSATNYNLINFFSDNITNDEKILTHWLCYITDRQTSFERVWNVGGFIFSQLVNEMKNKHNFDLLNPEKINSSYFIKREFYKGKEKYKFKKEDYGKYLFVSYRLADNNEVLHDYGFDVRDYPFFISRYYPADYKAILSTFIILQEYDFNFTKFIKSILEKFIDDNELIIKLLFFLYLLSYDEIGNPKYSNINFSNFLSITGKRLKNLKEILKREKFYLNYYDYFKKYNIYVQKRAWCALRDYFKSPEFSKYFFASLKNEGFNQIETLKNKDLLTQFELPGDVWNNNPKFRKCIFKETHFEEDNMIFGKLLREIYTTYNIQSGYPEQFDVTFDFIQRMCLVNNCSICPYGIIKGKAVEFDKICLIDTSKLCPVAYISCNYKINCQGKNCSLLRLYKEYN